MNCADNQKNIEVSQANGERRFSGDPMIGTIIGGRFQIEELLGVGGTSVVYKAKQLCVNRYVAVKTLKFQIGDRPTLGERFQREVSSLLTLNHPNIVTIYDCVFDEENQPFIVMDYLRGRSLDRLILEEGNLSIEKFLTIILQIFSAVEHAHKKGIVHRDLKPGNIVLVDDEMNFVKVVDFGLAKLGEESRKITRSGELWGSPPYMSPEQCIGEPVDERSDIYSLGAVMFEMLSGREPFTASTVYELIQQHLLSSPPPIAKANPDISVPPQLEKVVFKALSKHPDNRYQSIGELKIAVLSACSADVNSDSGTRIEAIATHVGGSDDLETYVSAMAPYVMCTSMRSADSCNENAIREESRESDETVCDHDTVCDADHGGSSWPSLRAGFWTSIALFVVSLVAGCFYVIGTVDGIRTNADSRTGSDAAYASPEHIKAVERVEKIESGSHPSRPVSQARVSRSIHHPSHQVRKPAKSTRTFVQPTKPQTMKERDPWRTLDGLRSR